MECVIKGGGGTHRVVAGGLDHVRDGLVLQARVAYRGTSLMRESLPLGPYSRTMPWPYGPRNGLENRLRHER